MRWARVNARSKEPVDKRCYSCVATMLGGYHGCSWESLLVKVKASKKFEKEFFAAKEMHGEQKPGGRKFNFEDCSNTETLGYMVMSDFEVYTESQFQSEFGVRAADINLKTEKLQDETGKWFNAIFVADPKAKRRLRVFSGTGLGLTEFLHHHQSQIREGQGSDMRSMFHADVQKSQPAAMRGGPVLSPQEIHQLVKDKQAAKENEEQVRQEMSLPEAPHRSRRRWRKSLRMQRWPCSR